MKIDLHVHSTNSDGAYSVEEIFREADKRGISLLSITDHDTIDGQEAAVSIAREYGIGYITGMELNVTFPYLNRAISLDFLGYQFDIANRQLEAKLRLLREYREARAQQILQKLNAEFAREGMPLFTGEDLKNIQMTADGALGRPHIAGYLVNKGIVRTYQEAFDRYLVKCDVPKYPLSLPEASKLVRSAGGVLMLAHPADPHGTALTTITRDLKEQTTIIEEYMLEYIDGVECWHLRDDNQTADHYVQFAREHQLMVSGGSDCHQKPVLLGTVDVPGWVAQQFKLVG